MNPAELNAPYDWNELDRAIFALNHSTAALPDVYRALTLNELCALIPYHPEMEGRFKLKNGMPCPFIMMRDKQGEAVMLFSSEARAEEGMKKGGVPENKYMSAAMPARQMLEVVGKMELRAIINRSCATGTFTAPPDLMLDLVSGVALQPLGAAPTVEKTLKIIEPADFPTNLIQPLFETLRRDRRFRAAWVMRTNEPTAAGGTRYEFLLLVDPRDNALVHDFNIVLQNSVKKPDEAYFGLIDEKNREYIDYLLSNAAPFHTAPDFDDVDAA